MMVPLLSSNLEQVFVKFGTIACPSQQTPAPLVPSLDYIHLLLLARNWQLLLSDFQGVWNHIACNKTTRLTSSCPKTGADATDACMQRHISFFSSSMFQCCRVSAIQIYTFRQQFNLFLQYIVSAYHPLPSFIVARLVSSIRTDPAH